MALGALLPSLIGAGSNLIDSAMSWGSSKRASKVARENTDKTIAANKHLAEYAYQKDLEMWNKANAYNSPVQQMQRLKEGGLNPNLVYGNGAVGNTSTATPKYDAPDLDYNYKSVDLPNIGSHAIDGAFKAAQIANLKQTNDNLEAQADKTRQETRNAAIDAVGKVISNNRGRLDYKTAKELQKYQVEAGMLGVEKSKAEISNIKAGTVLKEMEQRLKPLQIQHLNQSIRNLKMDYDLDKFELELNKLGISKKDSLFWRFIGTILNESEFKSRYDSYSYEEAFNPYLRK